MPRYTWSARRYCITVDRLSLHSIFHWRWRTLLCKNAVFSVGVLCQFANPISRCAACMERIAEPDNINHGATAEILYIPTGLLPYNYYSLICSVSRATHVKVLNSIIKDNTNFETFICYKLCVTISRLLHTAWFGLYWPSAGVVIG
jgi:hypothetical protein